MLVLVRNLLHVAGILLLSVVLHHCETWGKLTSGPSAAHKRQKQSHQSLHSCSKDMSWNNLMKRGEQFYSEGRLDDAANCFHTAASSEATSIGAGANAEAGSRAAHSWVQLGLLFAEDNRDLKQAILALEQAILLDPNNVDGHSKLGHVLYSMRQYERSVKEYQMAVSLRPNRADLNNLGLSLAAMKQHKEAAKTYISALKMGSANDKTGQSINLNLGNCYMDAGRLQSAKRAFQKVLKADPASVGGLYSLGRVQMAQGNLTSAIDFFQAALQHHPSLEPALRQLGHAFRRIGDKQSAFETFKKLVDVNPSSVNLADFGDAQGDVLKFDEAVETYTKSLELNPKDASAQYSRLHYLLHMCKWDSMESLKPHWRETLEWELQNERECQMTPIEAIVLLDEQTLLRVSRNYAARSVNRMQGPVLPSLPMMLESDGRLRVAYLGGGFREHPDGKNMRGVFQHHNQADVDVAIFSLKRQPGPIQNFIQSKVSKFIDVSDLDHFSIAKEINRHRTQVLLDVSGYTGEGIREQRSVVLAHHPARIQVNFLAWVATAGAKHFIQGIVTDVVASPPELQHLYDEKFVYMPQSYFPSSLKSAHGEGVRLSIAQEDALRKKYHIPDVPLASGFNQLWKISPELFDSWLSIVGNASLNRAGKPKPRLWLPSFPDVATPSLKEYAKNTRGMDDSDFFWSELFPEEDQFKVKSLSWIQLDAFSYNGHTSGADVLWAGVPILTLPGLKQSARVGASLLNGLAFHTTIARNKFDYEDMAVRVLSNKRLMMAMRKQFLRSRDENGELWDMKLWVLAFERALKRLWEAALQGDDHLLKQGVRSQPDYSDFVSMHICPTRM